MKASVSIRKADEHVARIAELTEERTLLLADLAAARKATTDLHEYLSKRLHAEDEDRQRVIGTAVERARAEWQQAQDELRAETARREDEAQATINALRDEIRLREADLVELRAFRDERERFEATLEESRNDLEKEKAARRADILRIERDHLIESDSIKKEMLRRVQAAKANFGAIAGDVLERTMQTTVLEHHLMGRELIEQGHTTDATIAENNKLRARNAELRRSIELLEQQVDEHAKRARAAQRMLERHAHEAAHIGQTTDGLTRRALDAERMLKGLSFSNQSARVAPSFATLDLASSARATSRPMTARTQGWHTPKHGELAEGPSLLSQSSGLASTPRSRAPTLSFDLNNLVAPRPPPVGPSPPAGARAEYRSPSTINRPFPARHRPRSAR